MADELENASEALLSFKNGRMSDINDDDMNGRESNGNPLASLGLQRVGDILPPKAPSQSPALNRRGMPARNRKRNRYFFDEDMVSPTAVVPKSMVKTTRGKTGKRGRKSKDPSESTPLKADNDRKLGQKIGMKLRKLLKLPKAQKWVCYEWFYSSIDKALFDGENDFTNCLKESFPQLKTYMLTRVEWCKMRRLMGKPRRCSQAFFEEERRELERKRCKIRQLQQRKPTDFNSCKDLPAEIPLQLVIGTKVTARLRSPHDGLFIGSIDAFDTSNNTYRITFERPGLGTHSIPDFEVLTNEPVETISVMSMALALRPIKPVFPPPSQAQIRGGESSHNGFPMNALENIVQLNKILHIKSAKVNSLREMNTEAERKQSFNQRISEDFVRKYASNIVELEHINTNLRQILASVQQHCQQLVPDMSMAAVLTPNYLRDQSLAEAKVMLSKVNSSITHPTIIDLVIELTALVYQIKSLSESDRSPYEVEVLKTSMDVIKKKLSPSTRVVFETNVEVHMRHIQSSLSGEVDGLSMSTSTKT